MSTEEDSPGVLQRAYRTVSPRYRSHHDTEMDAVGWAMILGLLVMLLPLLPFLVLVWLISKAFDAVAPTR